jgi:hypothetical protein
MMLLAVLLQGSTVVALDAELRASNSATAVLQARCVVPIRAEVDRSAEKSATPQVRADLGAEQGEALVYRLVRLKCGDIVYSRAENWYRPDRLTAAMNAALLSGDTPFGVVIRPLAPSRDAGERVPTGAGCDPAPPRDRPLGRRPAAGRGGGDVYAAASGRRAGRPIGRLRANLRGGIHGAVAVVKRPKKGVAI